MSRRIVHAIALMLMFLAPAPAALAQTSGGSWVLLGTMSIDLARSEHEHQFSDRQIRGGSRALRLVAGTQGLLLDTITVTYANGQVAFEEELPPLASGGTTRELFERDDALVVDRIVLKYRARPGAGSATIEIWGLPPLSRPRAAAVGPVDQKGYRELGVLFGTTRRRDGTDRNKNGRRLATFTGAEDGKLTLSERPAVTA